MQKIGGVGTGSYGYGGIEPERPSVEPERSSNEGQLGPDRKLFEQLMIYKAALVNARNEGEASAALKNLKNFIHSLHEMNPPRLDVGQVNNFTDQAEQYGHYNPGNPGRSKELDNLAWTIAVAARL